MREGTRLGARLNLRFEKRGPLI